MLLGFDNTWTSLMRKRDVSYHGRITCSLCASTLPLHFTYTMEGRLSLSECSAPGTLWLQSQLPSLAIPWGMCSSNSGTFSLGGGRWQSWYLLFKVVWWYKRCREGSATFMLVHGMPLPRTTPNQFSTATGALGSPWRLSSE